MAPRRGRKPTKNENATAIIAALDFMGVLKAPPAGSAEQYAYVFMNQGTAIGFDGVVAAGHPIPEGIAGYPHTKLLGEALDNTDKTFSLTVRENGAFEVSADKYQAIVPTYDPTKVIPTWPDNAQAKLTVEQADKLIAAFQTVNKVIADTGTTALYSSVRISGDTLMATNGRVVIEVMHGNSLPPVVVPKQFINAVLKAVAMKKTIEGVGINGADWSTLTIWFSDGAWLRTNLFGADIWTEQVMQTYHDALVKMSSFQTTDIPAKLWANIKAVLPFVERTQEDENRVIIRQGLVRTHMDRTQGAALETPDIHFSIDIDGKLFLMLEETATQFAVSDDQTLALFLGSGAVACRGIVMGLSPLAEVAPASSGSWGEPSPAASGWATDPALAPSQTWVEGADSFPAAPSATGWAVQGNVPLPPEDSETPRREAVQTEWKGGPVEGTSDSPEFLSQYHDAPESEFMPTIEEAFIFEDQDTGIQLGGFAPEPAGVASGWLNSVTDQDGGFNS